MRHGSDACGAAGSTPADLVFLYCTGAAIPRLQRQLRAAVKAPTSHAKRQQAYREQKNARSGDMKGEESNNGTLYFLMFFFGPPAAIALFRFIYL